MSNRRDLIYAEIERGRRDLLQCHGCGMKLMGYQRRHQGGLTSISKISPEINLLKMATAAAETPDLIYARLESRLTFFDALGV